MIIDLTSTLPVPLDGPALRWEPLPKEDVDTIAMHHHAGPAVSEIATQQTEIAYILNVDQYHRTTRGLDGIGYQMCPFASGRCYITARLDRYGASVGGENDHIIGVGLPGTFETVIPPAKQLEATREGIRYLYEYLGRRVPIQPHLYWGGTSCPGARWREWVPQLALEDDMDEETIKRIVNAVLDVRMTKDDPQFRNNVRHFTRLVQEKLEADLAAHVATPHGGVTDGLKRGDTVTLS